YHEIWIHECSAVPKHKVLPCPRPLDSLSITFESHPKARMIRVVDDDLAPVPKPQLGAGRYPISGAAVESIISPFKQGRHSHGMLFGLRCLVLLHIVDHVVLPRY